MAATIDATIKGANANSYVTLAEANAYFETVPDSSTWTNKTDDQKNRSLISATRWIDSFVFLGDRCDDGQALKFPRNNYQVDGVELSCTLIPNNIKYAQYELARALANDTGAITGTTGKDGNFSEVKLGDIQVKYNLSSQGTGSINNIFDVTTKPLIMDADTGGKIEHFELNVRSMERLGISAVIIEDKKGLKKNSLLGNEVFQSQEEIGLFCEKINTAVRGKLTDDFMIISRIESLIMEKGIDDALKRANAYVEAGSDGIMIHSRKNTPDEIFEFAKLFKKDHSNIPLVCVPTSFNKTKEEELANNGFNIIIYANHLLRASYPAMRDVAKQILINQRSYESDQSLISIKEILSLIPGTK